VLTEEDKIMIKLLCPLDVCLDNLSSSDWEKLIIDYPRLAEFCEWDKFTVTSSAWLLRDSPECIDYINDEFWESLDTRGWAIMMNCVPATYKHFDTSLYNNSKKLRWLYRRSKVIMEKYNGKGL
jgi:hypothetical protein